MLELKFNVFLEKWELNKTSGIKHYYEDSEKFIIYFKSKDGHEYYTTVLKSDIISFSTMVALSEEDTLNEFKINYISGATPLASWEKIDKIETEPERYDADIIENKALAIEPGEEMIETAENYEDLYKSIIKTWKTKTMSSLNSELNKSLSSFKEKLKSILNIKLFIKYLPKIVKNTMKIGLKAAEKELNVQIGFNPNFEKIVHTLTKQQLTGYTIDGKKWHGIKGVTDEQSEQIYDIVSEGVKNQRSIKDISADISNQFDEIMPNRAIAITRTESNRMINESKVLGFKESKVKGFKTWNAVMDSRTGDIDRRLHLKYSKKGIPMDDEFIDPVTQKRFFSPPSRTSCRCVIGISFQKHPNH